MLKRTRLSQGDDENEIRSKRQNRDVLLSSNFQPDNSADAYTKISLHSEALIGCLQELRAGSPSENLRRRLSELSKKLSPTFNFLAEDTTPGENAKGDTKIDSNGTSSPGVQASIPDLVSITPWKTAEVPSRLPALPRIPKPEIEAAVFRHPGLGHGSNYERLEWLGDAYIEMIATNLIFKTFGRTSAGRCSQIREQLVRNVTLAGYFREYGMGSRAQVPADVGSMSDLPQDKARAKDIIKVQGDMFEAYVAALVVSDPQNGLSTTVEWLKTLWGRTIKGQIEQAEANKESDGYLDFPDLSSGPRAAEVSSKERLSQTIVIRGIRLRYEDMPNGVKKDRNTGMPLYSVGVYLDGWGEKNKLLGVGQGLKKTEAGQKAAAVALGNKKLMKLYGDKKMAFREAQRMSGASNGPEGHAK